MTSPTPHEPSPLQPGLLALHGNRSEVLLEAVARWLGDNPVAPLEEEVILVQSNAMAEWLKMELAARSGVCAATRVELPAQFLWRTYRQVLGRDTVPPESPLDKIPMTWRIMKLLPSLVGQPQFAPVRGFLRDGEQDRTLQLAARLADLFDQYQIYRANWLDGWQAGNDVLLRANGQPEPVPEDQRWQPALWRALIATVEPAQREFIRPRLAQRFLEYLDHNDRVSPEVARRVTVFGVSQFPNSSLRALASLAKHTQVLLAVFNPCRYYWADIISGSELLRFSRRRHGYRDDRDISAIPLQDMHQHANPLLAAWGRQSRDFVRQLDEFDDAERARRDFQLPRIDLFDEDTPSPPTLLGQVQNAIRDLVPLEETRANRILPASDDRSIVFQVAHSKVRELEILQDYLLALLARRDAPAGGTALQPRDIVVMVPDIELMAPAIRAVFGQYRRDDPRYIPFDISDLGAKSSSPLVGAITWLLSLPQQRCRMSELVDLLEVPAIADRFDIAQDDLQGLTAWMVGAGIRWGLDAEHRTQLGLDACGEQNSALFGLHRMLLGYCSGDPSLQGDSAGFAGIDPYPEIGGLEARLAGSLFYLLESLTAWWQQARSDATPDVWVERARHLLETFVLAGEETDRQVVQAFLQALGKWRDACEQAEFSEPLTLAVFRAAWLEALNPPALARRFRAGGVTFCSLMPLRIVPFDVVCLLGMNDGDYPRTAIRSDFDLMALPGMAMPGDRSRREDDRQLMLEALLSARRALYVSWSGRSVRDNSEQPPSVLVSQLRDYIAAGWGKDVVDARTTEHPLQPFSRRYFDQGSPLLSYAREWRAAHAKPDEPQTEQSTPFAAPPEISADAANPLTLAQVLRFLRNPVKEYFRQRLSVVFEEDDEQDDTDDEPWAVGGLDRFTLIQELLTDAPPEANASELDDYVARSLQHMRMSGRLPIGGVGTFACEQLQEVVLPMLRMWAAQRAQHAQPAPRQSLRIENDGVVLEDWVDNLSYRSPGDDADVAQEDRFVWIALEPVRLCNKEKGRVKGLRTEKFLRAWLRSLACAAAGIQATGIIIDQDALITVRPIAPDAAREMLMTLMALWRDGMRSPLPLPVKTAIAVAEDKDAEETYEGGFDATGEVQDPSFARVYPDYEALSEDGQLQRLAPRIHGQLSAWVNTYCSHAAHGEGQ